MKIQPISPIHSILKYIKKNKKMKSWYEVRANGEKVAAFEPITPEALNEAHDLVDKSRTILYKDKMLQIVAVGSEGWEEIIHEEHPTVLDLVVGDYLTKN